MFWRAAGGAKEPRQRRARAGALGMSRACARRSSAWPAHQSAAESARMRRQRRRSCAHAAAAGAAARRAQQRVADSVRTVRERRQVARSSGGTPAGGGTSGSGRRPPGRMCAASAAAEGAMIARSFAGAVRCSKQRGEPRVPCVQRAHGARRTRGAQRRPTSEQLTQRCWTRSSTRTARAAAGRARTSRAAPQQRRRGAERVASCSACAGATPRTHDGRWPQSHACASASCHPATSASPDHARQGAASARDAPLPYAQLGVRARALPPRRSETIQQYVQPEVCLRGC
jgi:hypothetical protein